MFHHRIARFFFILGMHEVLVTNEGEAVRGAPHFLRSMPKSKKDYDGKSI